MRKTEIPSIRFRGFDDAWEQRKLGDIIIEYKETVDSDCTLPILTSSKTEGVILQEEHFGRKQQHDITGYNILPRNYCTYRNRSDGVDFTFNINKCCDKGIISKFYPVFSGKNSDVFFLSLVLNNSEEVVREIAYTCTGTGQKVLSFWNLQKMKVRAPSFDEQKEIAAYFEDLDHLITLHQSKYEKLQAIKASMLEKMFPKDGAVVPEVRFKGFTGAWKRKRFSELYESVIQKNDLTYGVDKNITVASMQYRPDIKITDIEYLRTYNVLKLGDIAFEGHQSKEFRYGRFVENDIGDGIVSHIFAVFRPKTDYDLMFWKYAINNERIMRPVLVRCTKASTMMNDLVSKDFLEESILVPDIEEQKKIGIVLSEIDRLISLQQEELKKLQSFKKALLEKMFV